MWNEEKREETQRWIAGYWNQYKYVMYASINEVLPDYNYIILDCFHFMMVGYFFYYNYQVHSEVWKLKTLTLKGKGLF